MYLLACQSVGDSDLCCVLVGDVFQALINLPVNLFTLIDAEYLITDHFYIALFSVSEQTHCILVACDSE